MTVWRRYESFTLLAILTTVLRTVNSLARSIVLDQYAIGLPSSLRDFQQVGSLLVDVFESPSSPTDGLSLAGDTIWSFVGRPVSIRQATNQYVATARRMKGKKYTMAVAKVLKKDDGDETASADGDVVGMAELGISALPAAAQRFRLDSVGAVSAATVGVWAVSPSARGCGVGRELVLRCESVALSWGEEYIYAAVEPGNDAAVRLFQYLGYKDFLGGECTPVKIRERLRMYERPHLLFRKDLRINNTLPF